MPHNPTLVPRSMTRTPFMCAYCLAALRALSCCSVSTENTLSAFVRLMAENNATCASCEGALSKSLLSAGRGTLLQPCSSLLFAPKCCFISARQLSAEVAKLHYPLADFTLATIRPTSANSVGVGCAAAAFCFFLVRLATTTLKPAGYLPAVSAHGATGTS